jgi:hypothetical protein
VPPKPHSSKASPATKVSIGEGRIGEMVKQVEELAGHTKRKGRQ